MMGFNWECSEWLCTSINSRRGCVFCVARIYKISWVSLLALANEFEYLIINIVILEIFSVMQFSLLSKKKTKIRNLKMHFYIRFRYKKLKLKTMKITNTKKNLE